MGQRTLRDIIEADDRLRKFNLIKNTKYDKSTWKFQIVDERSPYGGYEEFLQVTDTYYANTSAMNMELSERLFGKISMTAINCVINNELNLDNNAETFFAINGRKYDLIKSKTFRGKTHLYLEVMDNE